MVQSRSSASDTVSAQSWAFWDVLVTTHECRVHFHPIAQAWLPSPKESATRGVVTMLMDRLRWEEDTSVTATWDAVASFDPNAQPMHPFDVLGELRRRRQRAAPQPNADVSIAKLNEEEARWHLLMDFAMSAEEDLPRPLATDRRLVQKAMDALVALDGRIARPRLFGQRTSVPFLDLVPSLRDTWRELDEVLRGLPKSGRPRKSEDRGPMASLRRHGAMCFAAMSEAGVPRRTMLELVLSAREHWNGCPPLSIAAVRSLKNRRAAVREAIKRRIGEGRIQISKCRAEMLKRAEEDRREREAKAVIDELRAERREKRESAGPPLARGRGLRTKR